MRPYDWKDKYRWPDPEEGWSGPLAGYPPDHKIRGGRPLSQKVREATEKWCLKNGETLDQRLVVPESPVTETPKSVTLEDVTHERNAVTERNAPVTDAQRQKAYRERKKRERAIRDAKDPWEE